MFNGAFYVSALAQCEALTRSTVLASLVSDSSSHVENSVSEFFKSVYFPGVL